MGWFFFNKKNASESSGVNLEIAEYEKKLAEYEADRRVFYDDLDKSNSVLQNRRRALQQKKSEYDGATGPLKERLGRELLLQAKDLERAEGEYQIVLKKIDQLGVLIAQTKQTIAGLSGIDYAKAADELAEDREKVEAALSEADFAVGNLDKIGRTRRVSETEVNAEVAKAVKDWGIDAGNAEVAKAVDELGNAASDVEETGSGITPEMIDELERQINGAQCEPRLDALDKDVD